MWVLIEIKISNINLFLFLKQSKSKNNIWTMETGYVFVDKIPFF